MATTENPYLQPIYNALPRLLASYDTNSAGITYGIGDRFYWAWSLIDFANATIQGGVNGLARLIKYNLLPEYIEKTSILSRIHAIFQGTFSLIRRNGSLDQAFPYEGSYCGTALVLYDSLCCIELLGTYLSQEKIHQYLNNLRPLALYLCKSEETHGFISNHLAVASAALLKWAKITGEFGQEKGIEILNKILNKQSSEGWFTEYEGADPGYQTLCTGYLADICNMYPQLNLTTPIQKSIHFLSHFVHPDGSFGGVYGSRNTRFYFPAGFEYFAKSMPEAKALAVNMRNSISNLLCPGLESMDAPNLVPMFNSYCWAASLYEKLEISSADNLPCNSKKSFQIYFRDAGLFINKGINTYTIISTHKGGVVYHFLNKTLHRVNTGVVLENHKLKRFTNQIYQPSNQVFIDKDVITIRADIKPVRCILPSPWQFGTLRYLNISIMRIPYIREKIKQILALFLITAKGKSKGYIIREITLNVNDTINISDKLQVGKNFKQLQVKHPFTAIHMASQGYWQKQDDNNVAQQDFS
ncbi:hypothetical protein [Legionella londiniensis]|uniref:Uncharacterized protein n=1 Tax=Legionella londiniensis TaxID=45068 RepID=A0A0W0VN85_9GAMM|nr:hypothetical protein [Legionella londiniensis]KTD21585.1 hypothetical protein Llon_0750 [Legionella londiniensis]STX93531.1 Uncharacterised protein [Legionella londiniensis]